ncbi:MAG: type IV secretion system DNA-binding domain-containing protein [Candidatus Thiodiazotropha sp. (ex Troendleina suluensis)]|nr:type IV secretion system DNA-binding domain-containing protein [Candidatus Thiodiazotropha sp. (ex Troendleina suluensis)]
MSQNPGHVSHIGAAYHRYGDIPFGIKLKDRLMHLYVVGQTGTGKSTLIENLARQDAKHGIGFCLIDPHGDLAAHLSTSLSVPHLYWNIADPQCPLGYNPLTRTSAYYRPLVASGFIDTLKKQWSDAWGVRMEHLMRYAILALLEQPQADIRDILRLYTDKDFRRQIIGRIRDEQVYTFWTREYPSMNYKNAADGVAPIANKLGAWLAHPVVRKAICEPEKPLRFRQIMDQEEILIVNLAKGKLGSDTANVLGGLIVTTFMNAAFTRHDKPEKERRPFILYVDEFHSFTTTALASMLSETRKYGLGLVLAHQHIVQTDSTVFESILGNVGSLMVFRVGANDAPTFSRQLGTVAVPDLVNLPNYQAFMQLMVDGQKTRPFTVSTWPPQNDDMYH